MLFCDFMELPKIGESGDGETSFESRLSGGTSSEWLAGRHLPLVTRRVIPAIMTAGKMLTVILINALDELEGKQTTHLAG